MQHLSKVFPTAGTPLIIHLALAVEVIFVLESAHTAQYPHVFSVTFLSKGHRGVLISSQIPQISTGQKSFCSLSDNTVGCTG